MLTWNFPEHTPLPPPLLFFLLSFRGSGSTAVTADIDEKVVIVAAAVAITAIQVLLKNLHDWLIDCKQFIVYVSTCSMILFVKDRKFMNSCVQSSVLNNTKDPMNCEWVKRRKIKREKIHLFKWEDLESNSDSWLNFLANCMKSSNSNSQSHILHASIVSKRSHVVSYHHLSIFANIVKNIMKVS